jgi:nitrate reductase assembly molybdenum cofactor insertion protein NarJ
MTATLDPAVRSLLSEAAEWRLLGMLFECPCAEWKEQVAALARDVADPELRQAAGLAVAEAAEGVFHSLLGPGGPAPPREITYRDTLQPGYLLSELTAYYQAFAYTPSAVEAPDHVSVEAGFLGYLRLKQAYALSCGDGEQAAIAQEAAERFRQERLSYIAEPLSAALACSGEPYLELAGKALLRRVGPREKQMFDILDQGRAHPEDSVFECGES